MTTEDTTVESGGVIHGVEGEPSPVTKADMDDAAPVTRKEFEDFKAEFDDEPEPPSIASILAAVAIIAAIAALTFGAVSFKQGKDYRHEQACEAAEANEDWEELVSKCGDEGVYSITVASKIHQLDVQLEAEWDEQQDRRDEHRKDMMYVCKGNESNPLCRRVNEYARAKAAADKFKGL